MATYTTKIPIPVPTPYQSPQYGGNPYLKPGTTGQAISSSVYPISSSPSTTTFSNGVSYPSSSVSLTPQTGSVLGKQISSPAVPVPQNTPTPPTQQTSGGVNQGNLLQYFPGYAGWNPSTAWGDYLATGGAGKAGGVDGGDPYASLRGEITSGWDSYINSLNAQLEGLGGQRAAQEQIAQGQYQQGVNTLGTQKAEGEALLSKQRATTQKNQEKTLRDISSNLKNSFMAGNVYLGSRGAGDSSAANQYSHALTKLGTQQRGDVMGQTATILGDIDARESQLNNTYNTELKNLDLEKNNAIQQVAQWYADATNQIRSLQAQGQLGKSQDLQSLSKDILNQGIQQMNSINQYVLNKRQMLDSWATQVSTDIGSLRANMQKVADFAPILPGFSPVVGQPQVSPEGDLRVRAGYGGFGQDERQRGLFR